MDIEADDQVPWYTVPDLVGSRRVYIAGGMAYVPQSLQISLVLQAFSHRLEKALEVCTSFPPIQPLYNPANAR